MKVTTLGVIITLIGLLGGVAGFISLMYFKDVSFAKLILVGGCIQTAGFAMVRN